MKTYKIIFLGLFNSGKTTIIHRFAKQKSDIHKISPYYFPTRTVKIPNSNTSINLKIWDTADAEKSKELSDIYYKNADCAIFVYDLRNKNTLDLSKALFNELKLKRKLPETVLIVGNKIENLGELSILERQIENDWKSEKDYKKFAVSAKSGKNINELFISAAKEIYENEQKKKIAEQEPIRIFICGDNNSGKSSIIERISSNTFDLYRNAKNTAKIIPDIKITEKGKTFQLDLAEKTNNEISAKLDPRIPTENVNAFIIVYDISQSNNLSKIKKYISDIHSKYSQNIPIMILANKFDLFKNPLPELRKIKLFANQNNFIFKTVSAKNNFGLQTAFQELVKLATEVRMEKITQKPEKVQEGKPCNIF